MKELFLLINLLMVGTTTFSQFKLETITDTKTSEYYFSRYLIPNGVGGASWHLLDTHSLEFSYNISDSPPKAWKKEVGSWYISQDTVILKVDSKIPKSHIDKIPASRIFKSIILKIAGKSKEMPYWLEMPLHIDFEFVLLIDIKKFEYEILLNEILNYVRINLSNEKNIDRSEIFNEYELINKLIFSFCDDKKIPFTKRIYFNGNFRKYFD